MMPPLCYRDALDSRAVVGPGERTLPAGHVSEQGHHGGLQGVQSVMVGPVEDPFTGPKGVEGGGMSAKAVTTEAKVLMLDPLPSATP